MPSDNTQKDVQGHFLGIPYDFRRPTLTHAKKRLWNPHDNRIIVPMFFGWGYTVNLHALARRINPRN